MRSVRKPHRLRSSRLTHAEADERFNEARGATGRSQTFHHNNFREGDPVSRLLLLALSVLLVFPGDGAAQSVELSRLPVADTLLVRTQQWVDAWNEKDVEAIRRLHAADVGDQRYVIGNGFTTMEWLLKELREKNFWNVTWSIRTVEAKARMLGGDAGLVSFRLTGNETPSGGATHPFSEAFTLIFQRVRGEWLIVHVHDSTRLNPGS
jgi:ketosteroid isomerase-like protein